MSEMQLTSNYTDIHIHIDAGGTLFHATIYGKQDSSMHDYYSS